MKGKLGTCCCVERMLGFSNEIAVAKHTQSSHAHADYTDPMFCGDVLFTVSACAYDDGGCFLSRGVHGLARRVFS